MWLAFDLFIWGKVVSGMRGTLPHSSKLSATERLYVKSLCWPGHNISAPGFAHVLNFSNKPRKNSQSIVSKKNPSPPPPWGSPYLQTEWPSTESHSAPRHLCDLSCKTACCCFFTIYWKLITRGEELFPPYQVLNLCLEINGNGFLLTASLCDNQVSSN